MKYAACIIALFLCVPQSYKKSVPIPQQPQSRFEVLEKGPLLVYGVVTFEKPTYWVLKDKKTGLKYIFLQNNDGNGTISRFEDIEVKEEPKGKTYPRL